MFVWKVMDGPYCLDDLPFEEQMLEAAQEAGFVYW